MPRKMNKLHVSVAGGASGAIALGINLFFPHVPADQANYIAMWLPAIVMGAVAAIEKIWPKTAPVIEAAEQSATS